MKKILSLLLALTLTFALVACSNEKGTEPDTNITNVDNTETTNSDTTNEISNDTEIPSISTNTSTASTTDKNQTDTPTIEFDLSNYDSHGNLSCGRIWCSKVEGDWDTSSSRMFAYFDYKGNQISRWFDFEEYSPKDYENDFVILSNIHTPPVLDNYPVIVLDINGNVIANLETAYHHYGGGNYLGISEFNSDGLACCYALNDDYKNALFFIDKSGKHEFHFASENPVRSYSPDSMSARKLGDYIILYLGYSYNYYTAIFTQTGELVLNVSEALGGYEINYVDLSDGNLIISFEGADTNRYFCEMNMQGDIIKSPYRP